MLMNRQIPRKRWPNADVDTSGGIANLSYAHKDNSPCASVDYTQETSKTLSANIQLSYRFAALTVKYDNSSQPGAKEDQTLPFTNSETIGIKETKVDNSDDVTHKVQHAGDEQVKKANHQPRPKVVIVGDSMLKHVNPALLRKAQSDSTLKLKRFQQPK